MAKLVELSQIAIKAETTEGTAVSLANTDAKFIVRNITYTPGVEMYDRTTRQSTFGAFASVSGKKMATIGFEIDLYGNTASATAPAWEIIMKAAGLKATAASTTWVYTPSSVWDPNTMGSSDHKTVTVGYYTDGRYREIAGARCSKFVIRGEAGRPLWAEVEFQGAATNAPSTVALLSSVSYETAATTPPIFAGAALSLGGLSTSEALVNSFTLDTGITSTMRPDANSATGYRSCAITDRKATFSFDPEMTLISEHDFYSLMVAGTTGALAFAVGTSHIKIAVAAPVVQYVGMTEGNRGGLLTAEMTCRLCRSAGDDEFSITLGV